MQTISKGLLFLLDFFFQVEASGRCFKVCFPFLSGNLKAQQSQFSSLLYLKLWRGRKQEISALAFYRTVCSWGFCSKSWCRSGDAMLVGTGSKTSSGWIAGMHFARVIFSPSHSQKPAESGKSHGKVLRQSSLSVKLPRKVQKGRGICLATL